MAKKAKCHATAFFSTSLASDPTQPAKTLRTQYVRRYLGTLVPYLLLLFLLYSFFSCRLSALPHAAPPCTGRGPWTALLLTSDARSRCPLCPLSLSPPRSLPPPPPTMPSVPAGLPSYMDLASASFPVFRIAKNPGIANLGCRHRS